jgi:hypothetical protein
VLDLAAGPLPRFAAELRKLRREAGGMPYRQMARSANYAATVLSEAAGGRRLPTLEVTLAYVAACGGDEREWRARWHVLAEELAGGSGRVAVPAETGGAARALGARGGGRSGRLVALSSAGGVLLGGVAVLTFVLVREPAARPPSRGQVMPEHMVPFNAEATESEPAAGRPAPSASCSKLPQATACLDLANDLVWVRDLPPADGHHAAGYWTTPDGSAHGECHNYGTAAGPWGTCPLAGLPADARVGLRAAVVEQETVLTWASYVAATP